MLWLLVWRALRLRLQRVSVVFTALAVGATIVTALSAVWFDINSKMSELADPSAQILYRPGAQYPYAGADPAGDS